jgi:hypothetical protein
MTDGALFTTLEAVADEPSFIRFVEALVSDREATEGHALTPDGLKGEWANQTIGEFLSAASAWATDSGFGQRPGPKPANSWKLFALFLYAGRGYE